MVCRAGRQRTNPGRDRHTIQMHRAISRFSRHFLARPPKEQAAAGSCASRSPPNVHALFEVALVVVALIASFGRRSPAPGRALRACFHAALRPLCTFSHDWSYSGLALDLCLVAACSSLLSVLLSPLLSCAPSLPPACALAGVFIPLGANVSPISALPDAQPAVHVPRARPCLVNRSAFGGSVASSKASLVFFSAAASRSSKSSRNTSLVATLEKPALHRDRTFVLDPRTPRAAIVSVRCSRQQHHEKATMRMPATPTNTLPTSTSTVRRRSLSLRSRIVPADRPGNGSENTGPRRGRSGKGPGGGGAGAGGDGGIGGIAGG